ncbi:unnamed protein product [Urochloa humidicola]
MGVPHPMDPTLQVGSSTAGAQAAMASMTPRLNIPRPPKLPSFQAPRPARKTTGPKKKAPAACTSTPATPTPTLAASPSTPASTEAPNFDIEEDILADHHVFEGMSASVQSFSNMLDESVGIDNIFLSEPFPSVEEEADEDVVLVSPLTKKRGHRAANYSSDEDVTLVSAWLSVSLDAIAGVDQSSSTFWSRISELFHHNDKTTTTRTIGSLQHRWSTIQECCNKWAGCLTQVAHQRPSGVPLQEHVNLAQERYKDKDKDKTKKKPFTLFHCWTLLKHHEKWRTKDYENPPKRMRMDNSSPGHEEDEADEERDISPTPGATTSMRPPGRKREKEMLKKQAYGNGCKEAIQDMIETKKQLAMEKEARWTDFKAIEELKATNEAERLRLNAANEAERLRLKGEKALAKKNKEDQKIMFMDLSSLDDTQRAYVEAMRAKILAELVGTGGGGSI